MMKYLKLGNGPKTTRMIIRPAYMQVRWNAGQFDNTIVYEDFEDAFYDLARRGHCVYPYAARSSDLRYGTGHRFNEIVSAMAKSSKFVHISKPIVNIYRTHMRRQWEPLTDHDIAVLEQRAKGRYFPYIPPVIDLERHYFR